MGANGKNPIVLKRGMSIGTGNAESDDEFLFECFIDYPPVEECERIAFVNESIDAATGQATVSVTALRKAEAEFARKRKDALIQEWRSAHPALGKMLNIFAKKKKAILAFSDLTTQEELDDFALDICSDPELLEDPVAIECQQYVNCRATDARRIMQIAIAVMYRTGAIGLKLDTSEPYIYSHLHQPLVSHHLIRDNTKIRLHPMLHSAFHLHESQ